MAINKVVFGDDTLVDLTNDTVTEEDVLNGVTFHDKSGSLRSGSLKPVLDVEVDGDSIVDQYGVANITSDNLSVIAKDLTENKTATVTDGVADFETIDGSLVKSLVVEIEPSQSGSGTPSPDNIRPITGWTQEDVTVLGRNYCPNLCESMTRSGITVTKNSDGTYTFNGTATASTVDFYINDVNGSGAATSRLNFGRDGRYLYSGITGGSSTTYRLYVAIQKADGTIGYGGISEGQGGFDLASNEKVSLFVRIYNGYTCDNVVIKPMIRLREYISDTTFYPYIGKTYTTPFNQTVYGGTLDVLSGELTITHGYASITSFQSKNGSTRNNMFITNSALLPNSLKPASNADIADILINSFDVSESYQYIYNADFVGAGMNATGNIGVGFGLSGEITTLEQANSWLSSNPMQVVYELKTPTTLSLTPQTVKSLVGENHISASTGDVLECKFSMLINGDDLEMLLSSIS